MMLGHSVDLIHYTILCDKENHYLYVKNFEGLEGTTRKWGVCECRELGRYKFLKIKNKLKEIIEDIL